MGQPESAMQSDGEEIDVLLADRIDLETREYALARVAGYRGTGDQTEYKVRRYGYSARVCPYEPASERPTSFFRRY